MGTASHSIGTASLLGDSENKAAGIASVSMLTAGIAHAVACAIPSVPEALRNIVHVLERVLGVFFIFNRVCGCFLISRIFLNLQSCHSRALSLPSQYGSPIGSNRRLSQVGRNNRQNCYSHGKQ